MSPVDVECVHCHERFAVSISRSDQERDRCPRCGAGEVLLAALAGQDTRWYWGHDSQGDDEPANRRRGWWTSLARRGG